MRNRFAVLLALAVLVTIAGALWPRASSHAQAQSKNESLEMVLRRYNGKQVQLLGVQGEAVVVPTGTMYTENRTGHILFVTRRTDSFVIPYSAILYFREKPSTPVTPFVSGPPQIQLVNTHPK